MTKKKVRQPAPPAPAPRAPFDPNMSLRAIMERQRAGKLTLEDRRILDDAAKMPHRNEAFGRLRQMVSELEAKIERAAAMPPCPPPERITYLVDRYDRVQDMTLGELADLVDDADNGRLQRQGALDGSKRGRERRAENLRERHRPDLWLPLAREWRAENLRDRKRQGLGPPLAHNTKRNANISEVVDWVIGELVDRGEVSEKDPPGKSTVWKYLSKNPSW